MTYLLDSGVIAELASQILTPMSFIGWNLSLRKAYTLAS